MSPLLLMRLGFRRMPPSANQAMHNGKLPVYFAATINLRDDAGYYWYQPPDPELWNELRISRANG